MKQELEDDLCDEIELVLSAAGFVTGEWTIYEAASVATGAVKNWLEERGLAIIEEPQRSTLENTDTEIMTHPRSQCEGEVCSIHNRSNHSMRSFPQHWRWDRGIMERTNPFGGGCPDPDDYRILNGEDDGIHGCIVNPAAPYAGMCGTWYIDGVEAAWIDQRYAVTKDGRVWSFIKTMGPSHDNESVIDYSSPKELKGRPNKKGYLRVQLIKEDKPKDYYVHRLVLNAWKGECPKGFEARHLDGVPSNNNLDNLEWSSPSVNNMDKAIHGTMLTGTKHPNSKLTENDVRLARQLWKDHSLSEIVQMLELDVKNSTLHEAIIGKTWGHVI